MNIAIECESYMIHEWFKCPGEFKRETLHNNSPSIHLLIPRHHWVHTRIVLNFFILKINLEEIVYLRTEFIQVIVAGGPNRF
jgi:hypothetical protein